jgi:hypothetical protein
MYDSAPRLKKYVISIRVSRAKFRLIKSYVTYGTKDKNILWNSFKHAGVAPSLPTFYYELRFDIDAKLVTPEELLVLHATLHRDYKAFWKRVSSWAKNAHKTWDRENNPGSWKGDVHKLWETILFEERVTPEEWAHARELYAQGWRGRGLYPEHDGESDAWHKDTLEQRGMDNRIVRALSHLRDED